MGTNTATPSHQRSAPAHRRRRCSLYALLRRLLEDGLVIETDERPDPALDDERRRYYRLSPFGRDVAIADVKRLESVILQARAKKLATR